jgi:hypothetical protein
MVLLTLIRYTQGYTLQIGRSINNGKYNTSLATLGVVSWYIITFS